MRKRWNETFGTVLVAIVLSMTVVALSGCSGQALTTREKGTLAGGVIGAGTGAIVGSAVGAPGAGAAIGGALGAGAGALVGNELQNNETEQAKAETQLSNQQTELDAQRRELERLKKQPAE